MPPVSGRVEHWDAALPGFGLRISARGTKTWMLMSRLRGRQRRFKIGRYPQLDLASARAVARDYLVKIAMGEDPAAHRKRRDRTFGDVATDYIARECPQLSRGAEFERIIERELLSRWRDRPLKEINRFDVGEAVDAIMDRGTPYAAITLQQIIKRIFNWAISRGYLETSPAAHTETPYEAVSRDRVLNDNEVRLLWHAWDEMAWPFGAFMKLLLLTVARRNEVAMMKWAHVDAELALWTIPSDETKSGRELVVPLMPAVLDLVGQAPREADN